MNEPIPEVYQMAQTEAAELIDKSPVWLRDHVTSRLADGRYDARQVIQRVIAKAFDDGSLEEDKLRARNKLIEERIRKLKRHDDHNALPVEVMREVLLQAIDRLLELADEFEQSDAIAGPDAQSRLNQRLESIASGLADE